MGSCWGWRWCGRLVCEARVVRFGRKGSATEFAVTNAKLDLCFRGLSGHVEGKVTGQELN